MLPRAVNVNVVTSAGVDDATAGVVVTRRCAVNVNVVMSAGAGDAIMLKTACSTVAAGPGVCAGGEGEG